MIPRQFPRTPRFAVCLAAGLGAIWLIGGVPALAQNGGQSDPLDLISARLSPLNLTAAQQSQLNTLVAGEAQKFAPLRQDLRSAQMAFLRDTAAAADTAPQNIGDAAKNLAIETANLRAGINQILTPPQQAMLRTVKLQPIYRKLMDGASGARNRTAPTGAGQEPN